MNTLGFKDSVRRYGFLIACLAMVLMVSGTMFSQTTISTGSIQGTVTDPSGAVLGGAKVTITNKATGQVINTSTTSAGTYTSGALIPGEYKVRVENQGFHTSEFPVNIQVGVTSPGNVKLALGEASQVVEVEAGTLEVNTEQATVQGVVTTSQIENLPINGRNFLDLAQLEPGVQIQDGGNFDPTKKGFSSISFGGRFGRTARIEVDGVDVSDETVGTTTQDIPASAIQEFALGQSMLDLSTELTSSGSVNVVTRSGTNQYHGQAYYAFRDQNLDADLPGGSHTYFQRNQFGGNFGGAIIKDRLFFFVDGERSKQDFQQPVLPGPPFQSQTGSYSAPFREIENINRLDYQINRNIKAFYRFSYNKNSDVASFESTAFQPLNNTTQTRDHVVGVDFNTGSFTHSVRFGYMKFFNNITTGTTATTPFNPSSPIELAIGPDPLCLNTSGVVPDVFCSGQGFLAPQATPQSDHQIKYDGSKAVGSHILRYGGGFNHLQGGGFAGFLADGPAVNPTGCGATCQSLPGGASVALNYPASFVLLGNGQGFSTEHAAFGFPAGGLGPDNRVSWYVGDSWKLRPNLTVTYGLRYVRDTGRSDSDLPPIPQLNAFNNQFYKNLGNRVNNPNLNFAPQLGFAWDPSKNGKTVVRAGIGLFYENAIWNNVLFDRPARLTEGRFLATQPACLGGAPVTFTLPGTSTSVTPGFCGQPIGQAQGQIAALQAQYQAAAAAGGNGPAPNGSFIGSLKADSGPNGSGTNLFYPGYKTPRSVQMNVGVQHEIHRGTVFTADYLRNVSTHTLLAIDTNHVGDARFLNVGNAQAAIAATLGKCGAASIDAAIASCPALHPTGGGANISDFAGSGLDSGYSSLAGGGPCPACAFPGINPTLGANQMLFPIGRSVYNGLQMSLKQDVRNPFAGVRYLNLQVSYALSRYISQSQDGDFINSAWSYSDPARFIGPNGLDRTHQFSFGGTMELPKGFRINLIGHFYSPLSQNLTIATTGAAGGIFVTDLYGDGTGDGNLPNGSNGALGSILPGTNVGSFGRDVSPGDVNHVINNFNANFAGKPTPAGQALINAGLFTQAQLTSLGAVIPQINPAPAGEVGNGWLHAMDMSLNWAYRIKERVQLQPGVSFFNLFNFVNYDPPKNTMSGVLSTVGTAPVLGSANGTPNRQPDSLRVGLGSGVFGLGSPRVVEFSMKLTF